MPRESPRTTVARRQRQRISDGSASTDGHAVGAISDRVALATAAAVALGALLAPPVPWPAAVATVVLAVCLRRPPLLALALVLLVAGRANQQLVALAAPLPERVDGVAELADDPEDQQFGTQVVLRIDGRRYLASVPFELASPLGSAGTGDHVVVRGRPSPLDGAPAGWVRSRHLAGRLSVVGLERGPPAAIWYSWANAVRRTLAAGSASFDQERRPLYLGMVIGDDRALSELRQFRFRAAGLSHLTAVSGPERRLRDRRGRAVADPVGSPVACAGHAGTAGRRRPGDPGGSVGPAGRASWRGWRCSR